MTQETAYVLMYYAEQSVEAKVLSSTKVICLAFNVSQSINFLKYFYKVCFIKLKFYFN